MGNKSTILKTLPETTVQELIHKIVESKLTQNDLVLWVEQQGYSISKSAMNRFCIKVRQETNGFTNVGVPPEVFANHKTQFDELGRLLTQKLFIEEKIQAILHLIHSPTEEQETK